MIECVFELMEKEQEATILPLHMFLNHGTVVGVDVGSGDILKRTNGNSMAGSGNKYHLFTPPAPANLDSLLNLPKSTRGYTRRTIRAFSDGEAIKKANEVTA